MIRSRGGEKFCGDTGEDLPHRESGTMISGFKQKAADLAELPFKSRN